MSDLIGKAFAVLGEAPTSRELELVAAALEDEADACWLAAKDRAAFAALAEVALEHGSSGSRSGRPRSSRTRGPPSAICQNNSPKVMMLESQTTVPWASRSPPLRLPALLPMRATTSTATANASEATSSPNNAMPAFRSHPGSARPAARRAARRSAAARARRTAATPTTGGRGCPSPSPCLDRRGSRATRRSPSGRQPPPYGPRASPGGHRGSTQRHGPPNSAPAAPPVRSCDRDSRTGRRGANHPLHCWACRGSWRRRVDAGVDGGQVGHAPPSVLNTVIQSFLMLTTVQPRCSARTRDCSAALV